MKRYKDYMDGVKVSDTLHEKLKNLEEPKKRPQPWAKWGGMAAALVLVVGVGAYSLGNFGVDTPAIGTVEANGDDVPMPDIIYEGPELPRPEPGGTPPKEPYVDSGYEVVDGEVASYYFLPALSWLDTQEQFAMDYSLAPPGALSRDASFNDVLAFAGGERALVDHLLWDGSDWGGVLWFLEDGTPQAAAFYADGDGLSLSLEVMKGGEVPSCIVLPDEYYETSQWQGVKITALKDHGYVVIDGVELLESRKVSFFYDGIGYKLTLYADDAQRADEICARFVRYAIDDGFDLDVLSADGAVDPFDHSVGEPQIEPGDDGVSEASTADILRPGDEGYEDPALSPPEN